MPIFWLRNMLVIRIAKPGQARSQAGVLRVDLKEVNMLVLQSAAGKEFQSLRPHILRKI